MEEQKWIRVTKKYALIEDENPQDVKSPHTLCWLKVSHYSTYTTNYGNDYPLYGYEVFDAEVNPSVIQVGNLALTSFYDNVVHAFTHSILCDFKHSDGGTWSKEFYSKSRLQGAITEVFSYLRKHEACNSMHEVKLSETNESLKEENEKHLERIGMLEEERTQLREENKELEKQLAELHEVNKQLQEDLATAQEQLQTDEELGDNPTE